MKELGLWKAKWAATGPGGGDPGGAPGRAEPRTLRKRRLAAGALDAVLVLPLGLIPVVGGLAAATYWLLRDGLWLGPLDGRSLGKRLMGLRAVPLDREWMDPASSARRNGRLAGLGVAQALWFVPGLGLPLRVGALLLAVGLALTEAAGALLDDDGRRRGDRRAGTRIVEDPS